MRLTPDELGEPVWQQTIEFSFDGQWYRQEQVFFLVRVPTWEVDTTGFTEVERACVEGHRWWTVEELARTVDRIYPEDLTGILRGALDGATEADPVVPPAGLGIRVDAEAAVDTAAPVDGDGRVAREGEERC